MRWQLKGAGSPCLGKGASQGPGLNRDLHVACITYQNVIGGRLGEFGPDLEEGVGFDPQGEISRVGIRLGGADLALVCVLSVRTVCHSELVPSSVSPKLLR